MDTTEPEITFSDDEWRTKLTPAQYEVLRDGAVVIRWRTDEESILVLAANLADLPGHVPVRHLAHEGHGPRIAHAISQDQRRAGTIRFLQNLSVYAGFQNIGRDERVAGAVISSAIYCCS